MRIYTSDEVSKGWDDTNSVSTTPVHPRLRSALANSSYTDLL